MKDKRWSCWLIALAFTASGAATGQTVGLLDDGLLLSMLRNASVPSLNRAFVDRKPTIVLHGDFERTGSIDVVVLSSSGTVLCKGSNYSACVPVSPLPLERTIAVEDRNGSAALVRYEAAGQFSKCVLAGTSIACSAMDLNSVVGEFKGAIKAMGKVTAVEGTDGTYLCSDLGRESKCRLVSKKDAAVAQLSGSWGQMVDSLGFISVVGEPKVCTWKQLGFECSAAANLRAVSKIAVSRISDTQATAVGRSQLGFRLCALELQRGTGPGVLACEEEQESGSEGLEAVSIRVVPSLQRMAADFSAVKAAANSATASMAAGGLVARWSNFNRNFAPNAVSRVRKVLFEYEDPYDDYSWDSYMNSEMDTYCGWGGCIGEQWWDFRVDQRPLPDRTQCIANCDAEDKNIESFCNIGAGISLAAGPEVAGAVLIACYAVKAARRLDCVRGC